MLSLNFQTAPFEIEEYNQQPVGISYKFKGTDKVVNKDLFKVGASFPAVKSITFDNKLGNVDLMVHYGNDASLLAGFPNQIAQYDIQEGKKGEKTEKVSFCMKVSNNIHNIAILEDVEFIEEWTELEKIPIKKSPVTIPAPKKEEEKKEGEGDKPAEGEAKPAEGEEIPPLVEPKAEVIQPE